jgi:hypothetical protein
VLRRIWIAPASGSHLAAIRHQVPADFCFKGFSNIWIETNDPVVACASTHEGKRPARTTSSPPLPGHLTRQFTDEESRFLVMVAAPSIWLSVQIYFSSKKAPTTNLRTGRPGSPCPAPRRQHRCRTGRYRDGRCSPRRRLRGGGSERRRRCCSDTRHVDRGDAVSATVGHAARSTNRGARVFLRNCTGLDPTLSARQTTHWHWLQMAVPMRMLV